MKTMRRPTILLIVLLFSASAADAQWKTRTDDKPKVGESLVTSEGSGLMFGWFDPSKFSMRQSYSLSYSSFGGRGFSLGEYVNSMAYRISDPLTVSFDVSLTHSPFNSFQNSFGADINGLRLSRAQLDYRPSENTLLQVQFRQVPVGSYLYRFGDPFMGRFGSELSNDPLR